MELPINHKGLDVAESVEFFLKQSQEALLNNRFDDFLELVSSVLSEVELARNFDPNDSQYSLANARILMCGANLRVLMLICDVKTSRSINLNYLIEVRKNVISDIVEAKEHLEIAKITELNQAVLIAQEKLTGILDRYKKHATDES